MWRTVTSQTTRAISRPKSVGTHCITGIRFFSATGSAAEARGTKTGPKEGEIEIKIEPLPRIGEKTETKRARLLYQSRKRGILEADLILSRFASKYLPTMTREELDEYDKLLDETDWDIYYWAVKNYDVTPLPDKWKNSSILKKLQELSENKDREVLRMPDL